MDAGKSPNSVIGVVPRTAERAQSDEGAHRHARGDATPVLRADGLTKRYGDEIALADIALEVNAGEVLGLIGPNGAGKTTLLEALAGLLPVDSGTVFWRGAPVAVARRRNGIF